MSTFLRRPGRFEIGLQVTLAVITAVFLFDYIQARDAMSCFVPGAGAGCYPWGMTEGPLANSGWSYANKYNYLRSLEGTILMLAAAIVVPFFCKGPVSGIVSMLTVLFAGFRAMDWILERLIAG